MDEPLFVVRGLQVALPDMTRKPLLGRAPLVELLLARGADPEARATTEYATPLGWTAVGSRYSPDHPDDSFSAPDADHLAVARLLVAAGARIEPKFVEMATSPLATWLAEAGGGERR